MARAHDYEHLMIIYYDMLYIDGESLLNTKNSERFKKLRTIIHPRKGHAEFVARTIIDTSQRTAASELRHIFAQCIVSRGEGLVIKPNDPYFNFSRDNRPYSCCPMKLKKEYIEGWGDVGDFAVVGASYNSAKAKEYGIRNLKWTHFYIGCRENDKAAPDRKTSSRFRVTNIVELSGPVLKDFWAQPAILSEPYGETTRIDLRFDHNPEIKRPAVVFPEPLVFDMRCFAFDKEPNTSFWSMRFPQVSKIHHDRSHHDTITFNELQEIAEQAIRAPDEEEDSQEMREMIARLEKEDRGMRATSTSQSSTTTEGHSSASFSSVAESECRKTTQSLPTPPASSDPENRDDSTHYFKDASPKRSIDAASGSGREKRRRKSSDATPTQSLLSSSPQRSSRVQQGTNDMAQVQSQTIAIPGQLIGPATKYTAGPGTHIHETNLYSSLLGTITITQPDKTPGTAKRMHRISALNTSSASSSLPTVSISPAATPQHQDKREVLPEVGNVVLCRVTRITPREATVSIIVVGDAVLSAQWQGVVRAQDVRATEKDKVKIYESFRPGDIVRAQVVSSLFYTTLFLMAVYSGKVLTKYRYHWATRRITTLRPRTTS
jgi:exosome complex RNA-binding protein Csl4